MKIALVHDDFMQLGGAERLFAEIANFFPDAPIYTALKSQNSLPPSIEASRIKTSFMQNLPFKNYLYKIFLPLYPIAYESFDFSDYDLVISSTTRFAKSIITKPTTIHISYVNSTPRFLYEEDKFENYISPILRFLLTPIFIWLKRWDKAASARVDFYIANSKNVQRKINKFYKRKSEVIYPYADTEFFKPSQISTGRNYYLVVTRLVKWKKVDLAIKAVSDKLIIVGDGPDLNRLKFLAGTNVEFKSKVTKSDLRNLYQNAKALIVTQDEDFGITTVEAQASGTPAIAFKSGGSQEIIINGKTGVFFENQAVSSLKDAISTSSRLKYNKETIRNNALRFTKKNFEKSFKRILEDYVKPA